MNKEPAGDLEIDVDRELARYMYAVNAAIYETARRSRTPIRFLHLPASKRYPGMGFPVAVKPSLRRKGWRR